MSRITLFEPPVEFKTRLDILQEELGRARAELLLMVELCFVLMERLGLDDEPITALWTILSAMPLRHPRLQNLNEMERRAIANARQIVPFSGRFAWLGALRSYIYDIPQHWRNYDFDPQNLDLLVNNVKQPRHQVHQELYERCLSANLEFRVRNVKRVEAETAYQFEAKTEKETVTVQVKFTREQLDAAQPLPLPWFASPPARTPISFHIRELEPDAVYLDEREQVLAKRYNWDETAKGCWVDRYRKINFHRVQEDGTLGEKNVHLLELDGFTHVGGMVASGKSTLSLLTTVNILRNRLDRRITLVEGDVQSAIRLANQINWWFCDDPENDNPMAVPILGRSKRDAHLRSFRASKDYQEHLQRKQPHWGDRWLGTACPLQGLLRSSDIINRLGGKPIKPGSEPCHSLKKVPQSDRERRRKNPGASYLCPFFATCPSQQMYRDMPSARVWIVTPGAMSMAGLPRHLELRPIKLGELVYEQSTDVVFDEVDTIINWFDNVYAEEVILTNGNNGVFDNISVETEEYMKSNRVPPPLTQRWTGAERDVQQVVTATLTLLDKQSGHEVLRDWIKRGYFTPNTLLFKFARRLAGLEELDPPDTPDERFRANTRLLQPIMRYFDALLDEDSLRRQPRSNSPIDQLALLIQRINSTGESAIDRNIHNACKAWTAGFFPNTERRLARLRTELANRGDEPDKVDTLESLAYRLQFALTVTLLDLHTRIVFYEWHNRPPTIDDEPPHRRMPSAMLDILPLPPTGRQFGTYYSRRSNSDNPLGNSSDNALSLFAYTNIGRCYVLNFHRLLTDFDGRRGPNVLALSGTSYLPDSTRFHVGKPQGVLMPEPSASQAIAESRFSFLPQLDRRSNKHIRISGSPEQQKMGLFKEVARALVGNNGTGHLGQELKELKHLGENDPNRLWQDRDRLLLLVNSYPQAKWAADEIRQCWSSMREAVYHLKPNTFTEDDFDDDLGKANRMTEIGALNQADIEIFPQTGGKILVAPINAIGRKFNILNINGKAAFGAVYFLTRPYPHPHDTQAIAQEINRHALDWVDNADFIAWREDGVTRRAEAVRRLTARYWRAIEQRSYYKTLRDDEELCAFPRRDLAATTAGLIIQAVGRLLRGGVRFHAYFVDAAWAPNYAKQEKADKPRTSLLAAIIDLLCDYVNDDPISDVLYRPLVDALVDIEKFTWKLDKRNKKNS